MTPCSSASRSAVSPFAPWNTASTTARLLVVMHGQIGAVICPHRAGRGVVSGLVRMVSR